MQVREDYIADGGNPGVDCGLVGIRVLGRELVHQDPDGYRSPLVLLVVGLAAA